MPCFLSVRVWSDALFSVRVRSNALFSVCKVLE